MAIRAQNRKEMVSQLAKNNMIVADILSRLPVKTLLRFNSVCKLWHYMIDSSLGFQALHHDRSQRKPRFLLRWPDFDFRPLEPIGCRYLYNFIPTDTEGNMFSPIQVKVQEPVKLVLPGCFGLLCLATETRIYVFNPSTRRLLALPYDRSGIAGFGIGYLSSAKRHKIVRLNIPRQSRTSLNCKLECSVFTLLPEKRGLKWRAVREGCPYLVDQFCFPAFANETIYWKIDLGQHQALHRHNDFIVSFKLSDEKFQTITHPADRTDTPRHWRSPTRHSTQLVELRGHLHMVETLELSHVAIWRLTNPENSIWSKACTIDISKISPNFVGELQCIKGTEIIFNSGTRLLLYYDEEKKTFRMKILPCSAENLTVYCASLTPLTTSQG
ncbi:PREDICTED: putative F-box protein At1g47790 [Populus euphratica]|uniref:F-box protein At1g47790 n=1 Tax=Populus euphratica TaxID=75702 RepID=A0AAJ6SW06_POPEU|nr:PREDICTED: putative F-box protein At1g47790 [Populus euphratica]